MNEFLFVEAIGVNRDPVIDAADVAEEDNRERRGHCNRDYMLS